MKMSNLITRTITGVFFVAAIISSVIIDPYLFTLLFLVVIIVGLLEFYKLVETTGIKPQKWLGLLTGIILFLSISLHSLSDSWLWIEKVHNNLLLINLPFVFLIFIFELFRKKEHPFTNIAFSILGIVYFVLPLSLLPSFFKPGVLHWNSWHYDILLGYFILVWLNDTMAYVSGTTFGVHKLFERISPKKTWEGSLGGAVVTLLGSWLLSLFLKDLTLIQWLVMACIIIVFGTLGDLAESQFKRSLNCKDSGNIFPGHGGMLDRFDAVVGSAPFVYIFIQLLS